jgi:TonB-dependent SusC/RagA subfamily outer membrane receptor
MTSSPARILPVGLVGLLAGTIVACASGGVVQARPAPSPSPFSPAPVIVHPATSLEQLLAGRISGVTVTTAPGGGISVRIGGPTSFMLSSEPLYVVDGVPVDAGPNGTLNWLNPLDIASITVLKYGASTAIYGVRGANGVIVITTKRPAQ